MPQLRQHLCWQRLTGMNICGRLQKSFRSTDGKEIWPTLRVSTGRPLSFTDLVNITECHSDFLKSPACFRGQKTLLLIFARFLCSLSVVFDCVAAKSQQRAEGEEYRDNNLRCCRLIVGEYYPN